MSSGAGSCPLFLMDPKATELVSEIRQTLPYADDWLKTPHSLLGGDTPEERLLAGDIERVRNLVESIFYVGIT